MTNDRPDPSVTRQVKFDAICVHFEQAWRDGQKPVIETFLEKAPEADRPLLLPQLLLLELEYLEHAGTPPNVDAYWSDLRTIILSCAKRSKSMLRPTRILGKLG